ncbi:MAG: MucB/RseB C-terminal domain-containing protein [Pseudomonadota bacterium]
MHGYREFRSKHSLFNPVTSLSRRIQAVTAVAVLLTSLRAVAGDCSGANAEALAWLDKMSRGLQDVSYHGVVTFQRGEDLQAMQVSRQIEDGVATERLIELTGQGAEVIRVDQSLESVHPGHKLLRQAEQLNPEDCGLARYYRMQVLPGELVAGREAVRILLEPRDMYRFGYVMELDRETGLLLKSATLGRGDKVLERFQFASVSYTEESAGDGGERLVHQVDSNPQGERQLAIGSAVVPWKVKWTPQGFTSVDSQHVRDRRTYTDGMAVFSVFFEVLTNDIRAGEGVVRNGSTTAYTRGMSLGKSSILVTVIGEVPVNTARMVADSVTACVGPC